MTGENSIWTPSPTNTRNRGLERLDATAWRPVQAGQRRTCAEPSGEAVSGGEGGASDKSSPPTTGLAWGLAPPTDPSRLFPEPAERPSRRPRAACACAAAAAAARARDCACAASAAILRRRNAAA